MNLLLDTHVLIWAFSQDPQLSQAATEAIRDGENMVFVSAATAWEIAIKSALGKLKAPLHIDAIIDEKNFLKLNITPHHADYLRQLPNHHRDPFDRMLVAQAQCESLEIITADKTIGLYPARTVDANK